MKTIRLIFSLVTIAMLTACRAPHHEPPDTQIIQITCNPEFEYETTNGIEINKLSGDELISFRKSMILDDGINRCRFSWPIEGTSPASFLPNLTYTFYIHPGSENAQSNWDIVKITRDGKIVHEQK